MLHNKSSHFSQLISQNSNSVNKTACLLLNVGTSNVLFNGGLFLLALGIWFGASWIFPLQSLSYFLVSWFFWRLHQNLFFNSHMVMILILLMMMIISRGWD
jgi:hypothetical protein